MFGAVSVELISVPVPVPFPFPDQFGVAVESDFDHDSLDFRRVPFAVASGDRARATAGKLLLGPFVVNGGTV
ncbi:hypothetical protein C480_05241 [Natrialba aegyptia DSM 13077]|uniref:Uncharacterized protein n=1 Tax=Natrialba aegyptia DSM 13077 TaxID=1227491 RepID=M0BCQ6_9EURY|nr:hypothetical protein C480_05241 [Natrialba aegyptia DSM 13077]